MDSGRSGRSGGKMVQGADYVLNFFLFFIIIINNYIVNAAGRPWHEIVSLVWEFEFLSMDISRNARTCVQCTIKMPCLEIGLLNNFYFVEVIDIHRFKMYSLMELFKGGYVHSMVCTTSMYSYIYIYFFLSRESIINYENELGKSLFFAIFRSEKWEEESGSVHVTIFFYFIFLNQFIHSYENWA